jgi:hypothetical protein
VAALNAAPEAPVNAAIFVLLRRMGALGRRLGPLSGLQLAA